MNGRLYILQILCRQKEEREEKKEKRKRGEKRERFDACVCAAPIFHPQCFRVDLNNTATTCMWAWTEV